MRVLAPTLLLASVSLGACSTVWKPPEISYDDTPRKAVLSPDPPKPVRIVEIPKLLPLPGQLKPIPGAKTEEAEAADPRVRVEQANGEARVQPTRAAPSQTARSTRSMPRPARSPTSRSKPESSLSARVRSPPATPSDG